MNSTLTPDLRSELRTTITQQGFSPEAVIARLVSSGYDQVTATQLLMAELKAYRIELFQQADKPGASKLARWGLCLAVLAVAAIGPVWGIPALAWYGGAAVLAGVVGYWAYNKP